MAIPLKNILISDAVDSAAVELLTQHGFNVVCKYKLPHEQLIEEIKNYDGLIVRSDTKVKADIINSSCSLKVIGRAGTGVDNIDTSAATKKGVIVLNTPGGNSISACELTCSFITCIARNVPQGCQSLKEGRWDRKLYMGSELSGKTLAVLGLGRIGREVAQRMQAFGMRTIGFDPIVSASEAQEFGVQKCELDEIWPVADYITVHTPLIPQTKNLINDSVLSKCKKGVRIINVARGGIVDEVALLQALKDGRCGGAALDVYSEEPPKSPHLFELIGHPKVLATPHLGASTEEAQVRVAIEIAEQFIALANPASPYGITGCVNAPCLPALRDEANLPWIRLCQHLGAIVSKLISGESFANLTVHVHTQGADLENKKFLSTAVLVGLLKGRTKNGLNLINAPYLATEAGLVVAQSHFQKETEMKVAVSVATSQWKQTVSGTTRDRNCILLSINESKFATGVQLDSNTIVFQGSNPAEQCATLMSEVVKQGAAVTNISIAPGKTPWVCVQTSIAANSSSLNFIPNIIALS